MKSTANHRFPPLFAALAAVLLLGTAFALSGGPQQKQKQKQPPKPAATAPKTIPKPQQPALGPGRVKQGKEHSLGAPEITISVNCLQESVGKDGKPTLIEASITAAREDAEVVSVVLSKTGAFWGELFVVEVRNKQGKVVEGVVPRLVSKGEASVTLDGDRFGWLVWVLDPAVGAKLPPGDYSIRVLLDTSKSSGSGWKGTTWSPPARLSVKAAGAALSPDEQGITALAEIRALTELGRAADALAVCDRILGQNPQDSLFLSERGDILLRMGKREEAAASYDKAIEAAQPLPQDAVPEPPIDLIRKRNAVRDSLAKSP